MRFVILSALTLVGCTSKQIVIPEPIPINSIIYSAGPLDTVHPVYTIMLNDIVPSIFRGEGNTAFIGTKEIGRVGQDAVSMEYISELLRPWVGSNKTTYAPGLSNCPLASKNMPILTVSWVGGGGSEYKSLSFDYGCAASNPELAAALRSIPAKIGVDVLIGSQRRPSVER